MSTAMMVVPIEQDADGVLRVGGTRVTLDTVIAAFLAGAAPEEIALRYPSLKLVDIYSSISYYLQHQAEVEDYLQRRGQEAAAVREQNELRFSSEGIRSRLLARRAERKA